MPSHPNDSNPKTLALKLEPQQYSSKDFDGFGGRAILPAMPDTTEQPGPQEPGLDEQIAAYQREFRDLDPRSSRSSRPWAG